MWLCRAAPSTGLTVDAYLRNMMKDLTYVPIGGGLQYYFYCDSRQLVVACFLDEN